MCWTRGGAGVAEGQRTALCDDNTRTSRRADFGGTTLEPEQRPNRMDAGLDSCPECSILEPVVAWPDLTAAPVGRSGPCGYNARVSIDYNQPTSNWGNSPVASYSPGQVVDVQWCVDHNGDHGGMFSYRICQDQSLVDKFLDPDYLPTEAEKQAAEDCFEAGGYISGGFPVTKKIRIPNYQSSHTLLSFKWNSYQTGQIYLSCADIAIGGGSNSATTLSTSTRSATATPGASCAAAASVAVAFRTRVTTSWGQTVKIVGSIPELGNWDPSLAPTLSAAEYTTSNPVWTSTINLAAGTKFEYKFVKVTGNEAVTWESDPNRSYTVASGCDTTAVSESSWR
ncbi:hypothetical protein CHGG_10709 [Chaetomium globosum CBS 148.51]|uniref:CBM20 domain-containing protein n=1 Tax=Chaetomium globosum (strain ATCC 6205 / CBS 148.51 / DSM 1962 / NBRC 6347 / NRRL 1970) TaxID=306901 RepID=Q2GMU5_CHAGB|nr:uncharacterized protein CHGG_10709 [Chaetomium globosum CBS 148.51]EAQ84305.1 hypothetical protein CHGG_10709 [Chaetomium globosum CBS 148.51]